MAENIRDREEFVNQIIGELHEEKMRMYTNKGSKMRIYNLEHQRLTFKQIYTGESINLEDKVYNGIRHEDALRIMKPSHDDQFYYLNPVNKSRKKSKNKSKDKSKEKNSDKSK